MFTVTQRVKSFKQPKGGFININQFSLIRLEDDSLLNPENIRPQIVGTVVDYLTRFMTGSTKEEAFQTSLKGALIVKEFDRCYDLLKKVVGLDDTSILSACQLIGYDDAFRAGQTHFKPVNEIQPDAATIENIRIMVKRSLSFWDEYGPVISDGFTFEGGYTKIISRGDGDFLTANTLWDFKVLSSAPNNKHSLQLLVYYIMGVHSIHPEFKSVRRLGIFNPRLNNVYLLNIDEISPDIIRTISTEVIGYE